MAEVAITQKWLKAIRPSDSGVYWDTTKGAEGFGVRVLPSGRRAFVARFWNGTTERWRTLGAYPTLDLNAARAQARELVTAARGGGRGARRDPIEEQRTADRERQRTAEERRQVELRAKGETVARNVERWLAYLPTHRTGKSKRPISPATLAQYRDTLRRYILPELGALPVHDVTADDVERAHVGWSKRSLYLANRSVATLSAFYGWLASSKGGRVVPLGFNPASKIDLNAEQRRGEHAAVRLSPEQEARLLRAIYGEIVKPSGKQGDDPIGGTALLVLLDTGRRKSDVLSMQWSRLDLSTGKYDRGRSKGKAAGDTFYVSDRACAAIAKLPRIFGCDFIFTGTGKDDRRADLVSVWRRVKRNAALEELSPDLAGFHLHDLRHHRISELLAAGVSETLVIRQSGHTGYDQLRRYGHVQVDDVRRVLSALPVVGPAPLAEVVSITGTK